MAAIEQTETETVETAAPASAPALAVVPDTEEQRKVEGVVARSAIAGMAIGALICAGIWSVLVLLAMAGSGFRVWPMLWVGIACGIFAGMFLGGWAGTLVGASKLEHYEHEIRPGAH